MIMSSLRLAGLVNFGFFLIGLALCAWLLGDSAALGQGDGMGGMGGGMGGGRGGMGGGKGRGAAGGRNTSDRNPGFSKYYNGDSPPPQQPLLTPHCGQYLSNDANVYEIVYMPLQTRIYLFDKTYKPLTARNMHAQMLLQPSDDKPIGPIPFQYVAPPPGTADQDYVAAGFDLNQLPGKETPVTFTFSGLPDRQHPTASFTPVFTHSKIRPYVATALATEADRNRIVQQRICPVDGIPLGSKGPVIKLLIGDYPLYLCCKDCIPAVRQAPEKFLPYSPVPISGN